MRKLGIDFGDARIGLALSDTLGIIASGLETFKSCGIEKDIAYIQEIINRYEVDTLVIGLPFNMDGSSGIRVEKTKAFANRLKEKINIKVEFIDERLTTVESEKILLSAGKSREKRKELIDMISATIILENYLNKKM